MAKHHNIAASIDRDGIECVSVRLTNSNSGERATLYRRDYDAFIAQHGTSNWLLHGSNGRLRVRTNKAKGNGRLLNVAAEILGRSHVRYIDGDRCNLKRSNLYGPTGAHRARIVRHLPHQTQQQQGTIHV